MKSKRSEYLLLMLLLFAFSARIAEAEAARPLPLSNQERYQKFLGQLGVVCQCCDEAGASCRSTWDFTCAKLQCHPWKYS